MSTSIDRKLARCAREIAEAKPKGLSLDEFRFGSHELRMTASEAIKSTNDFWANLGAAKPLSAPPPIAETKAFKVGDLCKIIAADRAGAVAKIKHVFSDGISYDLEGCGYYEQDEIEAIPESPPKTEANGWVEWKGGDVPDYPEGKPCLNLKVKQNIEYKNQIVDRASSLWDLRNDYGISHYQIVP